MQPFILDQIKCNLCGSKVQGVELAGWAVDPKIGPEAGAICPDCFSENGTKPGWVTIGHKNSEPVRTLPKRGSFIPTKDLFELSRFRSAGDFGEQWWILEETVCALFLSENALLGLRIKTSQFERLSFDFEYNDKGVSTITCTGDKPKQNQRLSIHQKHRLRSMGLTEIGSTDTDWTIRLSDEESGLENVSRVVVHILQFGYLFQIHKLANLTPLMGAERAD